MSAVSVFDPHGVRRRLVDALHVTVVNAARRLTDPGLRDRVLAAEGKHVQLASLEGLFARRWRDEFGHVKCPRARRPAVGDGAAHLPWLREASSMILTDPVVVVVDAPRAACSHECPSREVLVGRLNQAIDAEDGLRHGTPPCTRRLWGDPVGLLCSRRDPHDPGPGSCRYVSGTADDHRHTTTRAEGRPA